MNVEIKHRQLKEEIKNHYEKQDYTEVVRDSLLLLMNTIRKKTDLKDMDGVDLLNRTFSEKKPLIKINKLETDTDKNKQAGIRDICKGLTEYFRNPMSHSKQYYSKEIADAILIILDKVLLKEIEGSKVPNSVEDYYDEIMSETMPSTSSYCSEYLKSIPQSKYLELTVLLYKNRNQNLIGRKKTFINILINNLTEPDLKNFCEIVENDLFNKLTKDNLIFILNFITPTIWKNFNNLTQHKIQDIIKEDIMEIKIECYQIDNFNYDVSQKNGNLLKSCLHLTNYFNDKEKIANTIVKKMLTDKNEDVFDFLLNNYFEFLISTIPVNKKIVEEIKNKKGNIEFDNIKKILINEGPFNSWFKYLKDFFEIEESDFYD